MPVKQILPPEARSLLDSGQNYIYLDVRSTREFDQGHVPGAMNIPLLQYDIDRRQMIPNADFMPVVEAVVPRDARVICGCASGQRSDRAAGLMQQAGYASVVNMEGGFTGVRDPMGRILVQGWKDHGLPVSLDTGGEQSYAALARRAPGNSAP
jgi:rhodanese-related sulfurtransferase